MIDCDLIAYYTPEEILPFKQTQSGARADNTVLSQKSGEEDKNPILILTEDIITTSGFGLRKGFYRVSLSDDLDFLLLYVSGKLFAKVPIVELGAINATPKKKFKKSKSWQFWHKKDHLGESSEDIIHKKCEIKYDRKTNSYLLFWERGNTRAIGVVNLELFPRR